VVLIHIRIGKQVTINPYLHRHYSDYVLGQNEVSTLLHILKLKKGLEENLTTFRLLKSRGENKFCYLTTVTTGFMRVTNLQQNKFTKKHEKDIKLTLKRDLTLTMTPNGCKGVHPANRYYPS
jgi:hypothetical protein